MRLFVRILKYTILSISVIVILLPMYLIQINIVHRESERLPDWISIAAHRINVMEDKVKQFYKNRFNFYYTNNEESHLSMGLQVDWWTDVCFERVPRERTWHPLFPFIPLKTTTMLQAGDDEQIVGNSLRRIYGYIYSRASAFHEFKLLSRDGAELLLLNTGVIYQNYDNQSYPPYKHGKEILSMKLTNNEMIIQDKNLSAGEMYFTKPATVWIEARTLYFVEIIQGGRHFTKFQLQWKTGNEEFKIVERENIVSAKGMSRFSPLLQKNRQKKLISDTQFKTRRMAFHKIPALNTSEKIKNSDYKCKSVVLQPKKISNLYDGYRKFIYKKHTAIYPIEHYIPSKIPIKRIVLDRELAQNLTRETFEKLNILHDGKLEFNEIVHIQENSKYDGEKTNWQDAYYFIEMDVKVKTEEGESKTYRASQYIQPAPDGTCFISDYEWQENVQINLITPIQNQKPWLQYLIFMLKGLQEKTNEHNINLIIIDSHSTDGDYQSILAASGLPYQYLRTGERKFSKVAALNNGLKLVTNENSIAFILDLHLQLPLNIFDRIRKLTIQGKTAFTPVLKKLACGEHEQYTTLQRSLWLDSGVGMMSMYKSDWRKIGGFNEKLFKNKWGGEDWEVLDRIIKNGLRLIQARLPDFYHIHHSKKGMWNGQKFETSFQY